LRGSGASAQQVIKARNAMRMNLGTVHPFATAHVPCHGKKIRYNYMENVVAANGSRQTNFLNMAQVYPKKIDFNMDLLAERYWPLDEERQVVVDPMHQFGAPTVAGTNINTLRSMFRSDESPETLAEMFNIPLAAVKDALVFHGRGKPALAA